MSSRNLHDPYLSMAKNCILVACLSLTQSACGQSKSQPSAAGDTNVLDSPAIGVVVIAIDDEIKAVWMKDKMPARRWRGGLFVGDVLQGSPAALAGIKPSDILEVRSKGESLVTPEQFSDWLSALKIGRKCPRVIVHRPEAKDGGRMIWKNFGVSMKPASHAKLQKVAAVAKAARAARPPVTLNAVAAMTAVQRDDLLGIGVFGNVTVVSIEPIVGGMYRVRGSDRIAILTDHAFQGRWVEIQCFWDVPEDFALRLQAGGKYPSELNIAGKIKQVRDLSEAGSPFEVVQLDLEDVRAR